MKSKILTTIIGTAAVLHIPLILFLIGYGCDWTVFEFTKIGNPSEQETILTVVHGSFFISLCIGFPMLFYRIGSMMRTMLEQ